jgi:hypothetical protein
MMSIGEDNIYIHQQQLVSWQDWHWYTLNLNLLDDGVDSECVKYSPCKIFLNLIFKSTAKEILNGGSAPLTSPFEVCY